MYQKKSLIQNLNENGYKKEGRDPILKEKLEEAVHGEMMAHLRYWTFADWARKRGMIKIANLFEALTESEYRHARNFYAVIEQPAAFLEMIETFIPEEEFE